MWFTKYSKGISPIFMITSIVLVIIVIGFGGFWLLNNYGKAFSASTALECEGERVSYCNILLYGGVPTQWEAECGDAPTEEECESIVGMSIGCEDGSTRTITKTCKGCVVNFCDPSEEEVSCTQTCVDGEWSGSCICTDRCTNNKDCGGCDVNGDCAGTVGECECDTSKGNCVSCISKYGDGCGAANCLDEEKPISWDCVSDTCVANCVEDILECGAPEPAVCGDGKVEGTEECDGAGTVETYCTSQPHGTCDERSCSGCKCVYTLKCDGSTCAVGSDDYNSYCGSPTNCEDDPEQYCAASCESGDPSGTGSCVSGQCCQRGCLLLLLQYCMEGCAPGDLIGEGTCSGGLSCCKEEGPSPV